jgi:hypothetical protein
MPRYFEGCLEFFAVFQNVYAFIGRFLSEPLMMSYVTLDFRWTIVGKNCLSEWYGGSETSK